MSELFAGTRSIAWCISPHRPACATRCSNPHAYIDSNVTGFLNVLEGCRHIALQASGLCQHLQRVRREP